MATTKVPVRDNKSIVKYRVLCSEKYGRYLVAGKKIDAGEVIIREKPVVIGPPVLNNDDHLCFECLKRIPIGATIDNSIILCRICQVATFCSVACEVRKFHHTIAECEILKNKLISFSVKDILLPLRLWLIKKKDEKLWEKILRLEAHLEIRRDPPFWKIWKKTVISSLKSLGIVDKSEEKNFPELLQQICGILDVNANGIPLEGSSDDFVLRGLYLESSLMNHDCRGNTFFTIDEEFELTVRASKSIDEGEMILFNYTPSLLGMAERQKRLRDGKYFECDCPMCEDPQELGTNLSTIFCPYCSDGLITFASKTMKNPYVEEKNWKCNKCQTSLSGYLIAFYLYLVKMRIASVENTIEALEVLLKKLSSTFYPNHFLMLDIKQKLLTLYTIDIDSSSRSSHETFNRVTEVGTDILDILEIVEPGISFAKGVILYYIDTSIFCPASRDLLKGVINREEFTKQFERSMKYLERSLKILQFAPVTSYEGTLAKRALENYQSSRQLGNKYL